jgi:hypothetical protein
LAGYLDDTSIGPITGTTFASTIPFSTDEGSLIFLTHGETSTFTAVVTAAVPEPSTWAMMIFGFAGIGFMAYRRKSKPVLTTA